MEYGFCRTEYLARKLIKYLRDQKHGTIRISGHTDVIGTITGNQTLSEQRAKEQSEIFRSYLIHLLGFSNENELDKWFEERSFAFEYRGYGSQKPYTVTRRKDNKENEILIGINELPEGRIANRRIEIEFIPHGVIQKD